MEEKKEKAAFICVNWIFDIRELFSVKL